MAEKMADTGHFGFPTSAIRELRDMFAQNAHAGRAVVYGSRAKGNYRKGSDIDISLEGYELTFTDLMRLEIALDDLMLPWKIDLSLISHINNPELLAHITRVGKPLWVRPNFAATSSAPTLIQ